MTANKIKFDSITRDKNGKILVIVIDSKPIIDPKEIRKIIGDAKDEHVKKDVKNER